MNKTEMKKVIVGCEPTGCYWLTFQKFLQDHGVQLVTVNPFTVNRSMELDELSDEELYRTIQDYSVYARVQPEHKIRIVDAWQYRGNVVSMSGDGVNDAPAIKSADIGVAMGITGTDVTKNVADMILADDNFSTIVKAVAEGRRIYDNMIKAIEYLLSSNLAEVLAVFIASMFGFSVLKPIRLLWINLITDTFPAIGIGMEEGNNELMDRAPRKRKAFLPTESEKISSSMERPLQF